LEVAAANWWSVRSHVLKVIRITVQSRTQAMAQAAGALFRCARASAQLHALQPMKIVKAHSAAVIQL